MPKVIMKRSTFKLYNEDCFETFKRIHDKSIDLVLCDPPYGTTETRVGSNRWDSVIPLHEMWTQLLRIGKTEGCYIFTAYQPFTSKLVSSNYSMYHHNWVWKKTRPTGFLNATRQPLRIHEDVLVFCKARHTYNRQGTTPFNKMTGRTSGGTNYNHKSVKDYFQKETNIPRTVLEISNEGKPEHPTQKPVELMEYLIKTYSNEGEIVLDFAMGSGTTGVACGNLGRRFIGCDNDVEHGYFKIAKRRIEEAYA